MSTSMGKAEARNCFRLVQTPFEAALVFRAVLCNAIVDVELGLVAARAVTGVLIISGAVILLIFIATELRQNDVVILITLIALNLGQSKECQLFQMPSDMRLVHAAALDIEGETKGAFSFSTCEVSITAENH